jgi:hypothetical protein
LKKKGAAPKEGSLLQQLGSYLIPEGITLIVYLRSIKLKCGVVSDIQRRRKGAPLYRDEGLFCVQIFFRAILCLTSSLSSLMF